jgi:hypothetical protein
MDGLGADQTWSVPLGFVAHQKRIAICKVRGDFAVIGDRDIGAFLPQLDPVPVIFESMRKQSRSEFLPARHSSEQHGRPPGYKFPAILQTQSRAGKWQVCGNMCMLFRASITTHFALRRFSRLICYR